MISEIIVPRGVPKPIQDKALKVHTKWLAGELRHRRCNQSDDICVLEVGRCYRMIRIRNKQWQLMTHEDYNKLFKKLRA